MGIWNGAKEWEGVSAEGELSAEGGWEMIELSVRRSCDVGYNMSDEEVSGCQNGTMNSEWSMEVR